MIAVDDGIWSGNFNFADVMFLVAFIVFVIAAVIRLLAKPIAIDFVLVAVGLACVSLAWLLI